MERREGDEELQGDIKDRSIDTENERLVKISHQRIHIKIKIVSRKITALENNI